MAENWCLAGFEPATPKLRTLVLYRPGRLITARNFGLSGQILGMRARTIRKIFETIDLFSVSLCLDIAGVASSILATPTIRKPRKSADFRGFLASGREPSGSSRYQLQALGGRSVDAPSTSSRP